MAMNFNKYTAHRAQILVFGALLFLNAPPCFANGVVSLQPRITSATRTNLSPKIDGDLNDECWKLAPVISNLVTSQPEFGKPAAQRTEVRLLYDNNAVYIGAYMYDEDPAHIRKQLSERDGTANADLFAVGFDTYNDKLNGYRFQVSAAGVQTDGRLSPGNYDLSWDAVWFSKVSIKSDGWVAEIKIPYSALRFPKKDPQEWGFQVARFVQRSNELSSWSPVNPQIDGTVNQWGKISNLESIKPPLRLSILPYFTTGYQREVVSTDPKRMANRKILSGGMDINWGINESFTLNTTLIPDFGQVQSDNKILNLSPFEQQFQERRPFFTEGTELFNRKVGMGPGQLFYSRRIGATPTLYYDLPYLIGEQEEIEYNPSLTQLYNATKFSGRTKSGLGIGILNSVAAAEYAIVRDNITGTKRKILTEPLTNYNVFVLDQSLKNNSRIGLTNTSVIRRGEWRDANVTSLNFVFKNKSNTFSHSGCANLSQIFDRSISTKPQLGFYEDYLFSKISGKLRFDLEEYAISDKYDQNDLGILFHGNEVSHFFGIKYFDFVPKGKMVNWDFYTGLQLTQLYKPFSYQELTINLGGDITFSNYWYMGSSASTKPIKYYDYYEARTAGVKFHRNPFGYMNAYLGTDARKTFALEVALGFGESPVPHDPYFEASITPTLRIKDRIKLSHTFSWNHDQKNFGFAAFDDEGNPVIGARQLFNITNTFSAQYNISPVMYVTLRARHYWSQALYSSFYNLDKSGNMHERSFEGNANENFNSWNIDFVYNWQFAPGSNLILTWKQNIVRGDQKEESKYINNVYNTFNTPQNNSVAVKLIYYLDYVQVKEWNDKIKMNRNRV